MKRSKSKNMVIVTIREENDQLFIENGLGQEWTFPKRMSERVALSALVYGALLNAKDEISAYSSKYRISIKIENLDGEEDSTESAQKAHRKRTESAQKAHRKRTESAQKMKIKNQEL